MALFNGNVVQRGTANLKVISGINAAFDRWHCATTFLEYRRYFLRRSHITAGSSGIYALGTQRGYELGSCA